MRRKLFQVLALLAFTVACGTAGYMIVEGWPFIDALYMTITTLTTVGFREVHPLSSRGIIFTIVLIVGGVGTVLYALSTGARVILEGELREVYGRKKLEKKIKGLSDHFIICGYGRMGKIIAKELRTEGIPFVVIEKEPQNLDPDAGLVFLRGDATQDQSLRDAGIERAKGLISVLPTDAENLFVVLSARGLNPDLLIVSRAVEEGSEQKLLRAGATKVVSPYHIGGLRMAHTVMKPSVVDFIEFATRSGNIGLQMQEISVQEGSSLIGRTLQESDIGKDLGVFVVAIKQATGDTLFSPTFRNALKAGDTLIVLGEVPKLKEFEEISKGVR